MKRIIKYIPIVILTVVILSCTYEFPEQPVPDAGSADFSKTVVVGSSLLSGYMNGALYTEGQNNSIAATIARQMENAGGGAFNQPDINSVNGFFGVAQSIPNVPDGTILGRLRLFGLENPTPQPIIPGDLPTAYAGDKTSLNNFSVPGITVGLALTPLLGTPGDDLENGLYTRFASAPGTSTVIGDAAAAIANNGTFFIFDLGANDVLGYAVGGASNPGILTDNTSFAGFFANAVSILLAANGEAKGMVINVPNIQDLPFFTTVPVNAIGFDPNNPVDAATVPILNAAFQGFNDALDGIVLGLGHDAADANRRKVTYSFGANPILIVDENLENLGPKFDQLQGGGFISPEERAALEPYVQARQLEAGELVTLTAASVLGTLANPMDPNTVWGVAVPMIDDYILTSEEITEISNSITSFNSSISDFVNGNADRVGLVDLNAIFNEFAAQGASINGSGLTSSLTPPFGGFSLDGVHPNPRGAAYAANLIIGTINAKFNASIPLCNPNDFKGNELPIPI